MDGGKTHGEKKRRVACSLFSVKKQQANVDSRIEVNSAFCVFQNEKKENGENAFDFLVKNIIINQ